MEWIYVMLLFCIVLSTGKYMQEFFLDFVFYLTIVNLYLFTLVTLFHILHFGISFESMQFRMTIVCRGQQKFPPQERSNINT